MEHRFTGRVEGVAWGRSRYTVIRVPEALAEDARRAGTRRVAGTVDGVAVDAAITRAPVVDGPFLWAGATLLRRVGAEPGEPVECVFAPADPDAVDLPEDVRAALAAAGLADRWEALPAAERRRRRYTVDAARRPGTRARRIAALVEDLGGREG